MLARLRKFRRTLRGRSARFIGHDVCGSFSMDFPTFSVEGETPRVRLASQCPLNRTSFRSSSFSLSREKYFKSINLWHIYGDSFFFKYHPDVSLAKHFSLSLSLSPFPIRHFALLSQLSPCHSFSFSPPKRRCVDV